MNEKSKTEIEELFSVSIDGEMTQRQQTELKRLLQHHPEMTEQMNVLARQRQLLCSLPVETAPESMVEDIKVRLERRQILDNTSRIQGLCSRVALVRRRFVAAAAMLFLPLGLLGVVVYHIVTPPEDVTVGRPTAIDLLKDDLRMPAPQTAGLAVAATMPFDGALTLTTERPMLAAQSIEKQIFLQSLEHQTIPNRTAEVITFEIDCPAEALADFMTAMVPLWGQITDSRLTLRETDDSGRTVTIPHVRPEQIQMLIRQTDKMPMLATARQYASATGPLHPTGGSTGTPGGDVPMTPEQLVIPRPVLAWPERDAAQTVLPLPTVRLTIEVRRPE